MTSGGVSVGIRDGMMHWAIATLHREILMPLLQRAVFVAVGFAFLTKAGRAQDNN